MRMRLTLALYDPLLLCLDAGFPRDVRSHVMRALLAPLMVLLLVVTACGPLPRPFQPESKLAIDLRAPSTRAPMRVEIPTGQVPGDPKRFALKVSERLLTLGIPAEPQWFSMAAAPALETHRLRSVASVAAGQGATEKVEVAWSLVSPAGNEKSLAVAQIVLPRDVWESENTKAVDDAAFVSAATIARALETSLPTFDLAEGDGPRLVVLPVEGATGDGSESLEYAITRALQQQGLPVAAIPQEQDLLLWCLVDIGPTQGGAQLVTIRWRLELADDFTEIGTVTQENLVPAYSLAGPWRDSADQIAQAAAEGILALVQQAGIMPTEQLRREQ